MDFEFIYVAVIAGVLALAFALFAVFYVLRQEEGSERMREISAAIKEGALAFLHREYQILAIFVVVVAIILYFIPQLSGWVALAFVFGALCPMCAGYVGMNMAMRSNARTEEVARKSLNHGPRVSFFGRSGKCSTAHIVGHHTTRYCLPSKCKLGCTGYIFWIWHAG